MIGTTREEMAAFYCIDQEIANADAGRDRRRIRIGVQIWPPALLRRDPPDAGVGHQCGAARRSDERCDVPHRQSAHGRVRGPTRDGPAYVYQFDWQSPAGFESCHCLEIPFVFNNFANWTDSPMLKGAKPAETTGLAEAMHGAWIAFARTGKPDHPRLPAWPPYRREDRMTMRFDSVIGPVSDLAGLAWRSLGRAVNSSARMTLGGLRQSATAQLTDDEHVVHVPRGFCDRDAL